MVVVKLEAQYSIARAEYLSIHRDLPTVLACCVKSNVFTMHIKNLTDEVGRCSRKKSISTTHFIK